MTKFNLLFIFTDEQRADSMAAYGNLHIETPNLNRLALESVIFDQAYVTQPVCTPSRSSIMTGLYPHTNGCTENNRPLPPGVPCLPEMLADGDYVTAYHGKWHLGDEIFAQHGFDEMLSLATKEQIERATTDPVQSVMTHEGWKFNCSPLGEHELYNLKDDLLETRNLAAAP